MNAKVGNMQGLKPWTLMRRNLGLMLSMGIGAVTLAALAGCAGIPTDQQITDQFDLRITRQSMYRDLALASCARSSNPAPCKDQVESKYRELLDVLNRAENAARDGQWNEAKELREQWDQLLRDFLKSFGLPSIKDFFQSGFITTDISLVPQHVEPMRGASGGQGGTTSTGSGGVHYEPPCIYETINVSGTVETDSGDTTFSTWVSGSMEVCWDTLAEPGSLRGQLVSGELGLWHTYPPVVLTLDTTTVRTIEAFETGGGRIQAWFNISIPSTPWAAIMSDRIFLDLPLSYSAEAGFSLSLSLSLSR
ncbi:MAG: hypothetical protein JNK16_07655 [Phycisphaerales bacterium]|nr:hypothetical protein [Phycisphaerales bacterium]